MSSLQLKLSDIYDVAILRHGFHSNNRDYIFLIETNWTKGAAGQYLITFKDCFELDYRIKSNDIESIDWDGNWAMAYPGFQEIIDSELSKTWSKKSGIDLKQAALETEIYIIEFLYSSFTLKKLNDDNRLINKAVFSID